MVKYWIKNISGNIEAVFFKLGTRNVYHKRNQMTPIVLLPWKLSWLQSLSVKNQISSFSTLLSGTEGPAWNRHGSHIVLTLIIRLAGVDGPWWRQKLGISVLIKTGPAAKLLSWQQHNRCHLFLLWWTFLVPSLKNTASIFPEIFFIQYFTISVVHQNDVITFLICIIQKRQYL